jgi:hypothetical protein
MPAPTGSRRAIPARRASTSWPPPSAGRNGSSRPSSAGVPRRGATSGSWNFWTWASPVRRRTRRSACPVCRNTTMTGPPAGPAPQWPRGAQPRPLPARPAAPEAALVAAIGEAVQDAVGEALMEPAPRPSAVAPEAVARALTEALDPVDEDDPGPNPKRRPPRRSPTRGAGALIAPPPPAPAVHRGRHPRLLDRLAALWRVAGRATSHHAAERLLLQTALAELGTFDEALRRVVQRSGGYEARFAGMTEDQARAPARGWTHATCPARPSAPDREGPFSGRKTGGNLKFSHTKTRGLSPATPWDGPRNRR